jgi:hypothetical protein
MFHVSISCIINSQVPADSTEKTLEFLYKRLLTNFNDSDRVRINDSIVPIIDNYVKSDSIFYHRFKNLRYLGQITSPDSVIKIVTWNLVLADLPGRYYCYLIKKNDEGSGNKILKLVTNYKENKILTDTIYSESNWYGALYYDIRPCKISGRQYWMMTGIDYGNPYISRKLIDILSFNDNGSLKFGMKCFVAGQDIKYRDVFEYASNGMMTLRFRSDKSIVFDHLVPFTPSQKDDRQYYGPDYSYDAYDFENGFWKLKINVDARNNE